MSVGLIGRKLGMTQGVRRARSRAWCLGYPGGTLPRHPGANRGHRRLFRGAAWLQSGAERKLTRAERGHLGRMPLYRCCVSFRTQDADDLSVGDELTVANVDLGQRVDVIGVSKGKGFAGVMKRHGFRGGKRTHGQSDRERAPGSIGAGTSPSRVFKGRGWPGEWRRPYDGPESQRGTG